MITLVENSSPSQTSFFPDHFEQSDRGWIGNLFYSAARASTNLTVDTLIEDVKSEVMLRMVTAEPEKFAVLKTLLSLLATEEAQRYAAEVINREALSSDEKLRLRAEREEMYRRQYLMAQRPTARQLRYLKFLGCSTVPGNRLQASELIEASSGRGGKAA